MKAAGRIIRSLLAEECEEKRGLESLNRRELEILKQAAKGKSNKVISEELVIGERTVQTHMANIFKKLGVGSRTEAVLHALRKGWIILDELP